MDRVGLSRETHAFQTSVLGYARLGILAMANNFWTWIIFILTAALSLWRLRGVKGFSVGFTWWGKHAQLRVMIQSFSSSCSSPSNQSKIRKIKSVFADDDLNIGRNKYMDDLDLLTYGQQNINHRGICRRSKSKNKSSSTFDSLTLCNSIGYDCLDANRTNLTCFLQAEMEFSFEKLSSSGVLPNSPLASPLSCKANPIAEEQMGSPALEKWDCMADNFERRLFKHKQACKEDFSEQEFKSFEDSVHGQSGKCFSSSSSSSSSAALEMVFNVESRDKCKGNWFAFDDDEEEEEADGEHFSPLDACISLGAGQSLVSFESQYGWDRLLSFRLGFEWNCYMEEFGLNLDSFFPKYFVPADNVSKVFDGPERRLMKLFCIPEDIVSSIEITCTMGLSSTCTIDNNVGLWDVQVAKCLNEMAIMNGTVMGTRIQDSHGSLLTGIVTRHERTSVFVWDPRVFFQPISFCLGNKPISYYSLELNDKKFCVSDGLSNKLFDFRMFGASPIEVSPAKLQKKNPSSLKEETAWPIQNTCSEEFLLNDDDICEGGGHGHLESTKSCMSLMDQCIGAFHMLTVQPVK